MASSDPPASTLRPSAFTCAVHDHHQPRRKSWPNEDASPQHRRCGRLNGDTRGMLGPSSILNSCRTAARGYFDLTALSLVFRQATCGAAARSGRPPGCALRHCNGLCRPDFSRSAPVGLLRKEKSLRHSALASLGLPAQSSSPPAIAPADSC
jgi:hypothetical protein